MRRLEHHMLEPIHDLMLSAMSLDVVDREFSAGYGRADLVGADLCTKNCEERERLGIYEALDNRLLLDVMMSLSMTRRTSVRFILSRVAIAHSTLVQSVLPKLARFGLIKRYGDGYVRALLRLPCPAKRIVAVEAKQTKWREAILQARRYTFFANQTYVAVWDDVVGLVDRTMLYQHRLGLIGVNETDATTWVEAPFRNPRRAEMSWLCAEHLYKQAL